ncbi:MAG: UDP-glucose 4-epimerase GalE [Terrimesophilobacter sp.]
MTWLVTGGAGYIGSHVVAALLDAGMDTVVVDDLSTGREAFIPSGARFVQGDILNGSLLLDTFERFDVSGVVHIAGFKYAGVSVDRPLHTYEQNVTAMAVLLGVMQEKRVERIVFSSSAAVYGTPDVDLVTETTPASPESPYGETKLIGEWLLRDLARATTLAHTSLRYFNVVGSGLDGVFDVSPHNLFPLVFEALLNGETPRINGGDYPTPDGTCVRDYVHVADIALAHVAAARRLEAGETIEPAYNLGSGNGVSVAEIMAAIAGVTGIEFTPTVAQRRTGDPARIVASGVLATRDLGWTMRHSLIEMVESAWRARQQPSS